MTKLSMSDDHYSVMNNENVSGKIYKGCRVESCDSRPKDSVQMLLDMDVIFLNGKLTIAQKINDKLRQGVNLSKMSVGQH